MLSRRIQHFYSTSRRITTARRLNKPDVYEGPVLDDIYCDPKNPLKLEMSQITEAAYAIKGAVEYTACRQSRVLSQMTGMELFLKMELVQETGSFKERGARWALMNFTDAEKKAGVYAASAGNHAQALCLHGRELGIPVTVVMPRHAPIKKIDNCRRLGGNIHVTGKDIGVSRATALQMCADSGGKYINGYDHIDILAGAGTVGLEIMEQVRDADAVVIPVGGGGLLAGVATAIKAINKNCKIIAVEAETCPGFKTSFEAGEPVRVTPSPTLADGLAVPLIGCNSFESAKDLVDEVVVVDEKDIGLAILRLLEVEKVITEGAGACGLGALISGQLDHLKGKKVVSIVSGGNIDITQVGRVMERGLAWDNRLVRFKVVVSDRPYGIAELTKIIAECGASIKDMFMERAWLRKDVFTVRVKVIAETRDSDHAKDLELALKKRYSDVDCYFNHQPYESLPKNQK